MSSGVAQAAYAQWSVLAILCATVCGWMLMAAEREGLSSQAWFAAVCFALWALLAALTFWEAV
jgi:hypothetical protein